MSFKNVTFLALAQDEMDNIFQACQYQKQDLGYTFLDEVKEALIYIKAYPDMWQKNSAQTHRYSLKQFPYSVIYQVNQENITILAISSLHKKPTLWATKTVSEYSTDRIAILPATIYTR